MLRCRQYCWNILMNNVVVLRTMYCSTCYSLFSTWVCLTFLGRVIFYLQIVSSVRTVMSIGNYYLTNRFQYELNVIILIVKESEIHKSREKY